MRWEINYVLSGVQEVEKYEQKWRQKEKKEKEKELGVLEWSRKKKVKKEEEKKWR